MDSELFDLIQWSDDPFEVTAKNPTELCLRFESLTVSSLPGAGIEGPVKLEGVDIRFSNPKNERFMLWRDSEQQWSEVDGDEGLISNTVREAFQKFSRTQHGLYSIKGPNPEGIGAWSFASDMLNIGWSHQIRIG
ncbi:hypothetical protein FEM03_00350 [Phragmitibacter flavus]|uniref:Uncharacterized protein n=1 Tax=Phragmitibacter flavus TaxID=2576071 RepID=A0A5R8KJZ2_9BACT|nr:hypothetical protein [Phragmitibacter flavus]TLD72561.1 hypothetical protein FEM03_00350 [Phragmitibacter flavus]